MNDKDLAKKLRRKIRKGYTGVSESSSSSDSEQDGEGVTTRLSVKAVQKNHHKFQFGALLLRESQILILILTKVSMLYTIFFFKKKREFNLEKSVC